MHWENCSSRLEPDAVDRLDAPAPPLGVVVVEPPEEPQAASANAAAASVGINAARLRCARGLRS
jgi:hypothetical protein